MLNIISKGLSYFWEIIDDLIWKPLCIDYIYLYIQSSHFSSIILYYLLNEIKNLKLKFSAISSGSVLGSMHSMCLKIKNQPLRCSLCFELYFFFPYKIVCKNYFYYFFPVKTYTEYNDLHNNFSEKSCHQRITCMSILCLAKRNET